MWSIWKDLLVLYFSVFSTFKALSRKAIASQTWGTFFFGANIYAQDWWLDQIREIFIYFSTTIHFAFIIYRSRENKKKKGGFAGNKLLHII